MRDMTSNIRNIVGINEVGWLSRSQQIPNVVREASPDFPRILLIDEDVSFTTKVTAIASQHRIHLVTCRSAKDLHQIDSEGFDVAILDFASGELARRQVGHFLGEYVPVLIVGESPSSSALEKDFPAVFRKVLDKDLGARAVLEEALALVGARHFLENPTTYETERRNLVFSSRHWYAGWLFLIGTLIIFFARPTITQNYPRSPATDSPKKMYRWDKAPIIPHSQFALLHPRTRGAFL